MTNKDPHFTAHKFIHTENHVSAIFITFTFITNFDEDKNQYKSVQKKSAWS
jgi:hypothetical protein